MTDDTTRTLLEEIRDAQREHLAEYRSVTRQSLDLQKQAVMRQEQLGTMYRRVIAVGGVASLVVGTIINMIRRRTGAGDDDEESAE